MRSPAFAGNAAGSPPGGIGGPGTEAGVGRRTQDGHGPDSLAEANRIHGATIAQLVAQMVLTPSQGAAIL